MAFKLWEELQKGKIIRKGQSFRKGHHLYLADRPGVSPYKETKKC
jgi:hypothetical protein